MAAPYILPQNAIFIGSNPNLKTIAELELENFRLDTSVVGGNNYSIIRTNFTVVDQVAERVPTNLIEESQARLLIARVYGLDFDIANVSINGFSGLTQRQRILIQNYLRKYQ
jgi:hypothetical protein